MKVVATIEARMSSSRLPCKVLRPILGRPVLELLIERLRRAKRVQQVVLATTVNPADEPLAALARRLGVGWYRGSEEDVLDRVLKAALAHEADLIVEITGDSPLLDPVVVDRVIETFLSGSYDYVSNNRKRTYPLGLDVQVFPTRILTEVAELTQDPADREHVSLYIYEHAERYRLGNVESGLPATARDLRLTLDTREDLAVITAVFEELYPKDQAFGLDDVLALFERRPELAAINRNVRQRAARG